MRYPILAWISIGNRPNILNCVSPGAGHSVKIEMFQIISNVLKFEIYSNNSTELATNSIEVNVHPKPLYVYQIKFAFNLLYSVRDGIQRVK